MPTDGISNFGVDNLLQIEHKHKGVFKFYTGITYNRFTFLLSFLTSVASVKYEAGRRDINKLQAADCLFLTLCRLRHNFRLQDLAVRFNLSLRSTSDVFNEWIQHMYLK